MPTGEVVSDAWRARELGYNSDGEIPVQSRSTVHRSSAACSQEQQWQVAEPSPRLSGPGRPRPDVLLLRERRRQCGQDPAAQHETQTRARLHEQSHDLRDPGRIHLHRRRHIPHSRR